ncbi:hypothetical protein Q9L58_005625 [Maublancomyces gigas]|uniref:Uncharacterized protein n=1 Tax=Discina gigas TaxID=1032678 RepID=A0ABR3GHL6_9PEZI
MFDNRDKLRSPLLVYAERHPARFALSSVAIVAGLVAIIVPLALGFGGVGPVAGTVAAAWQAAIGNVVAGSCFAMLQSMTMTGTLMSAGGGLIAVGVAGLAGGTEWARRVHWAKNVDWARVAGLRLGGRLGGVEQWARAKL